MRSGLSQRAVLVLVVAGLAAVAARVAAPAPKRNSNGLAACGVERWTVKTLQDKPKLLRRQNTTVAHLISVAKPAHLPNTRLPFERHVFTVTAAVTLDRQEADGDLHLVLFQVGKNGHMIAEAPSPSCTTHATAYRRRQMTRARAVVRICGKARVTGVAFFDFLHGQTGVAPNGIELHPILGFDCLSGLGAAASP